MATGHRGKDWNILLAAVTSCAISAQEDLRSSGPSLRLSHFRAGTRINKGDAELKPLTAAATNKSEPIGTFVLNPVLAAGFTAQCEQVRRVNRYQEMSFFKRPLSNPLSNIS